MAKPICVGELHEYVDKDGTVWTLRVLGSRVWSYLQGLVANAMRTTARTDDEETITPETFERHIDMAEFAVAQTEIVRWGVEGVQNFGASLETKSEKRFGKPLNVLSDRFLDRIPMATIQDLYGEIRNLNMPTEEELKNSESQPSLPNSSPTAEAVEGKDESADA